MNYVFISPAYPVTCTHFCKRLNDNGVNVLGIGDMQYDELNDELKSSLTEYFYVDSLEDYDQVYRAVAFFIHKYGRIDWLESLNEYWLEQDARLRTDFNIAVGTRTDKVNDLVRKSTTKKIFVDANIPTARQQMVSDIDSAKDFIAQVGYPVIVKPDLGVGSNGAWKIENEDDLLDFYSDLPDVPYVMEQFLSGNICTYDAILDSNCEPLFESMCTYPPVLDSVINDDNVIIYTRPDMPDSLRALGRKTVKAFGADSRFVHFEFINIDKDYEGIGKAGDFAVMEVNMRPSGGHNTDMMNFAESTDVFQIYAEMVTKDKRLLPKSDQKYYCAYAARKDGQYFTHTHEEVMEKYADNIVLQEEMPPIDWPSMGRYIYIARFLKDEESDPFFEYVLC